MMHKRNSRKQLSLPRSILDQVDAAGNKSHHSQQLKRTGARRSVAAPALKKQLKRFAPAPVQEEVHELDDKAVEDVRPPTIRREPTTEKLPATKPAPTKLRTAVKAQLDDDDKEIARLEKKLKLKSNKIPKSFADDGLDFLLDGLDDNYLKDVDEARGKKRKREGSEIIAKDTNTTVDESIQSDLDDLLNSSLDMDDQDSDSSLEDSSNEESCEDEDEWSGIDEKENNATQGNELESKPKVSRYIPPSLRGAPSSTNEEQTLLRRKVQGQINRLSEANILQILSGIEDLYRNNPRHHITSTLTDVLLASVSDRATLTDTFMILHAGFIAAMYRVIGLDFGAHIVQTIAEQFEKFYNAGEVIGQKECNNFMTLLAEMYNFGVVGPILMFDYIRLFVEEVSELNTELLLKIVRISGHQLRQDDPTALKDIVTMLQPAISKVGMNNLSTRTRFMVESLTNLKNNKLKTSNSSSVVTSTATVRMKKILGTLNSRSLRASEPLRASLKDIKDVESKGKWWLVGASWRNDQALDTPKTDETIISSEMEVDGLLQVAKEQRMNTDIRRAIFVTIMSSADYKDACERLLKLRLKRSQEREIPRVLIHCCGSEQNYNHYYTVIAKQLCQGHTQRMTFQFCLWEIFRELGEEGFDGAEMETDKEKMSIRKIVNLAKFFGNLVGEGVLPISVLKILKLSSLQPSTMNFMEPFFITVLLSCRKEKKLNTGKVRSVFNVRDSPDLARGIGFFLNKHIRVSDLAGSQADTTMLKKACTVAEKQLASTAINGGR